MKKSVISLMGLLFVSVQSHAQLFGPRNYEDCVLQNIKTAKTDAAIASVHAMCRSKFSNKPPTGTKDLTDTCILYWDGLRTTKLSSEPKDWRDKFISFQVSVHEMPVALVFVPKTYKETSLSKQQMYEQVSMWCR
jgi:hypothetical protein